jgi:branched-chain amino acid transport system substrate-binding protein
MDPTDLDATPELTKLKSTNPDVLVLEGFGAFVGVFLKSRAVMGWDIPTVGDGDVADNNLGEISSPADWNNLVIQASSWGVEGSPASTSSAFKTMSQIIVPLGVVKILPDSVGVAYWDMAVLAMAGLAAGGAGNAEKFKDDVQAMQTPAQMPKEIAAIWVGYPDLGFTNSVHSLSAGIEKDFVFIPAAPIVNGLITKS